MGKFNRGNKRGGGRGGGRGGRGGGGGGRSNWGPRADYQEVEKHNELFEKLYNELGVVPEDERKDFWNSLRRELPNSFRFAGSKGHALAVQQRLVDYYVPQITSVQHNGEPVEPPRPVDWFPEKLAWSMTTPKNVVRKFPPFASFQKFLVSETSVGNISRQEIVSMIPPLLMDVRPGMTCLDMCAAPGSKSAQLVEMVHGGEEARIRKVVHEAAKDQNREASPDGIEVELDIKTGSTQDEDNSDDGRATGLLVANDVEYRRAQMLVHQVKRLNSPNIVVTNHDASQFPSIRITSDSDQPKYLKFDRILADVPCSGDGTCRKNPNIWKDWIPGNGLGLHNIQVRILVRSLQMLKVGGRVVYSTCSMNPVENEAVVSAAISRCGGSAKVSIIDCSKDLPGLKRSPGFKQWKIMDKSGRMFGSWKEVQEAQAEGKEDFIRLTETMFPYADIAESEVPPFERCLRLYPHMQDTGGFFVCVLEKQSEIKALPEAKKISRAAKRGREVDETSETASAKKVKTEEKDGDETMADASTKEDPTDLLLSHLNGAVENGDQTAVASEDIKPEEVATEEPKVEDAEVKPEEVSVKKEEDIEDVEEEVLAETPRNGRGSNSKKSSQIHEEPYKYLPADHPELLKIYEFYQISERFPKDRFMVRNATGEPVKAIYYTSTHVRDILNENEGRGMKFVQAGVKMFMKQDAQGQDICRWRIQSEGLPILEPWVGEERIVRLYKRSTLKKLLIEMFPKLSGEAWKEMGEIGERVRDISMGCCVLRVETSDGEDGFKERIVLPLWRSMHSLNLMLPKEERKAMLLRLYNDNSELIDHSKIRADEAKAREAEAEALIKEEESATTGADADGGVRLDAKDPAVIKAEETVVAEEVKVEGEEMKTEE
ncbi:hypothetical protein EG327_005474 [Venturia inaequalis]|uniref:SAM-dependent MTase RsmB/NOP-type domain-containing protein n=1 Tax=Venturia inaequalis TaxID=5025 RepID=A0A8H3V7E7_VENIN|nr:hypothetical protein EG327_005474 [Venturia inaequalis]